IKDYIAHPKPNGYRSLHAILEVPVFLHGGPVPVICEVQIRTIAMDFWASLEHKIHYKFNGDVPDRLIDELTEAPTPPTSSTDGWSSCTPRSTTGPRPSTPARTSTTRRCGSCGTSAGARARPFGPVGATASGLGSSVGQRESTGDP